MNDALPMPVGADLEHCQVVGRDAIVSLLREVAVRHSLLTVHFGGGREAIVSTLLEADPLKGGVVVDCGSDARANARLLEADRLTIVTFLDHIRIQFATGPAREVTWQGGAALRIALPATVLRLQRRQAYRVRVPLARPGIAHVAIEGQAPLALKILDISAGGIAVLAAADGQPLETGTRLEACRVELPEFGEFEATLEVRYGLMLAESGRTKLRRHGLAFRDLAGTTAALIQRYILFLERQRHR